jgi:sugar transferase (PEP-CTERM system associated)
VIGSSPSSSWPRHGLSLLAESAILIAFFVLAYRLRLGSSLERWLSEPRILLNAVLHATVMQICLYYGDLYEESAFRPRRETLIKIAQTMAVAWLFLTLTYFAVPRLRVGRGIVTIYAALAYVGIVGYRRAYFWAAGNEALADNVLIVGTGSSARQLAREVLRRAPLGFRLVGFLGEHAEEVGRGIVNPSVIGTLADLVPIVEAQRISLVIVALDDRRGKMPVSELLQCRLAGVRVEEGSSFYERLTGKILVRNLRPSWLVFSQGFNKPRLFLTGKRVGELLVAVVALLLAAPVMILVALLVKLDSRGPIFYRQERVGEKGRSFLLLKFRTMRADAEAATGPVWATGSDDSRLTRVGGLLRRARLDELPQLINVLAGEMSFCGPRPERPHFVEQLRKIIPYYGERHSVKPGITGWAQIKFGYGSNIEDAEEKLQYDLYYIKNMSLRLDISIMLDTLKVMVTGRGAR